MLRWALKVGRTVRELNAAVTSEEIVEMMAFDRLEPMGALPLLHAFGQVCAVTANVHRGRDSQALEPGDFFPPLAREIGKKASSEPVLLSDPEAQSALIKRTFFGGK